MNSAIQLTTKRMAPARNSVRHSLLLITSHYSLITILFLALCCFALGPAPKAFGVSPPPDGGYAGANTAEGTNALFSLTSGLNNTAVGFGALLHDTSGSYNVGIGEHALALNTSGNFNMAIGSEALYNNTGNANANVAIGFRVLYFNRGDNNTGVGAGALYNNIYGSLNTAVGAAALSNSGGIRNTAIGYRALFSNGGSDNTATGVDALYSNTRGQNNVAIGLRALYSNTTNYANVATGDYALYSNIRGGGSTANGYSALYSNTTGNYNIAIGYGAGSNLTTGSGNIDIGNGGVAGEGHTMRIGDFQTATFIAGIYGETTGSTTTLPVIVDLNGQLGTAASSERFKTEIKPMDKSSEAILALKPATFHYKNDSKGRPQFGLIAEEVAKVNPDLVVRDAQGEIYTVRYEAVNAMLLNEFLKEHRTVQELKSVAAKQEADIAKQQKQIEALTTGLQKVSDQLELSKATPQIVVGNQ